MNVICCGSIEYEKYYANADFSDATRVMLVAYKLNEKQVFMEP